VPTTVISIVMNLDHLYYRASRGQKFYLLSIRPQFFIAKLVTTFIVVFVFEEAVYGRLALSMTSYLIAKTATEVFLYLVLLLVLCYHLVRGRLLRCRPTFFDFCMAAFLLVALMSTVINHGSLVQGLLNVRTMLRYMAIYYIIVLSGWVPTEKQLGKIFNILIAIALLQAFLAGLQHFAGDEFRDRYFGPLITDDDISGLHIFMEANETKIGVGYGTFGKPAAFAFFLLFVSVTILAAAHDRYRRKKYFLWGAYFIVLLGIVFSYKRGALLLAIVAPFLVAWFMGRKRYVLRYIGVGLVFIPLIVGILSDFKQSNYASAKKVELSPIETISQLLTQEYWENTNTSSRGWVIQEVGSEALSSLKLIGYGADPENAQKLLAQRGGMFEKLVGWNAFEDVYIVAATVYYGPIGVVLLVLSIGYIFRMALKQSSAELPQCRKAAAILATIIILMLGGVFLERILELRAFAFPFWVFAGMVVAAENKCDAR